MSLRATGGWSTSLTDQVRELADLPAGWHDGAGVPVTTEAVVAALTVCRILAARPDRHWGVSPTVDGPVVFEELSPGTPDAAGCGRWVTFLDVQPTGLCDVLLVNLDDKSDDGLERAGVPAGEVGAAMRELGELRDPRTKVPGPSGP